MSRIAINDDPFERVNAANGPSVNVPKLWEKRVTLSTASDYPCQQFTAVMIEQDQCGFILTESDERIDLES